MTAMTDRAAAYFSELQIRICAALDDLDGGGRFREDAWQHAHGGGGCTRVLLEGKVFEKAGVNFSQVRGEFTEDLAKTMPGDGRAFVATGISLVLQPWNPYVPTVHANFRCLSRGAGNWFGGGADLTPYYLFREDCIHFHRTWRAVCDRHPSVADFARFKKWCDEYFYLPHRQETRGIGGIFFDYLQESPEATFAFVRDAGDRFLNAYLPIARRRKDAPYNDRQRGFQLYRRGRYVEFNLLYDRGTVFGLKTGGRVESILMSLPLNVKWLYDYKPEPGSPEAELQAHLVPHDWAGEAM